MQHSTIPTKRFLARAAAAVLFLGACQPLFADQTVYYWANTNGGNWTASANWVMEDGCAATTYPHVAGDVAVFDWFWLDDKPQKRGTYGATGSGATFVDDALFSGPGLLTVKKELGGTMMLMY